jgi:hypothetical protein
MNYFLNIDFYQQDILDEFMILTLTFYWLHNLIIYLILLLFNLNQYILFVSFILFFILFFYFNKIPINLFFFKQYHSELINFNYFLNNLCFYFIY